MLRGTLFFLVHSFNGEKAIEFPLKTPHFDRKAMFGFLLYTVKATSECVIEGMLALRNRVKYYTNIYILEERGVD